MRYSVALDIELPRARVIELFDDPANLVKWQEGLVSFEPLTGTPGRPGARSRLVYRMGKREVELIETVTRRELPERFDGTYEMKGVWNAVKNRFEELGPARTRWASDVEFRFSGFMRFVAPLMKKAFSKQSMKFMHAFKAFAEEGRDVRAAKGA